MGQLASSVLTLEPDSRNADPYPANGTQSDPAPARAAQAAPPSIPGWGAFDDPSSAAEPQFGGVHEDKGGHGHSGDFHEVSLSDSPSKAGAGARSGSGGSGQPASGGEGAVAAALRRENAGLRQRLTAVEAVRPSRGPLRPG